MSSVQQAKGNGMRRKGKGMGRVCEATWGLASSKESGPDTILMRTVWSAEAVITQSPPRTWTDEQDPNKRHTWFNSSVSRGSEGTRKGLFTPY